MSIDKGVDSAAPQVEAGAGAKRRDGSNWLLASAAFYRKPFNPRSNACFIAWRQCGAAIAVSVLIGALLMPSTALSRASPLTAEDAAALTSMFECEIPVDDRKSESSRRRLDRALAAERKIGRPSQTEDGQPFRVSRHPAWGMTDSELTGLAGQGFAAFITTSRTAKLDDVVARLRQRGIPLVFDQQASANKPYRVFTTPGAAAAGEDAPHTQRSVVVSGGVVSMMERYEGPGVTVFCAPPQATEGQRKP